MSIENIHYRLATAEDQAFIDAMNVVAGYDPDMHESELPTLEKYYKEEPGCRIYAENFGRSGDLGLIALDGSSQPLGAVWGRVYDRTHDYEPMRPYPFELAIAVREHARGQGIGRQLLDSFAMAAWLQGHDQVSLVVERGNPARALYEAAGYEPLRGKRGREVGIGPRRFRPEFTPMVRDLDFVSAPAFY
jgi:GNAT superfamily N-acetyltransferase